MMTVRTIAATPPLVARAMRANLSSVVPTHDADSSTSGWACAELAASGHATGKVLAPFARNPLGGHTMTERIDRLEWRDEDDYWRTNYRSRPYAGTRDYSFYQPGYRYAYDSAERYPGRTWNEVEPELSRNWEQYEHRGTSTWEQIKDAVRDAWDRVTGKRTVGAGY
jgi:hypothetical protein